MEFEVTQIKKTEVDAKDKNSMKYVAIAEAKDGTEIHIKQNENNAFKRGTVLKLIVSTEQKSLFAKDTIVSSVTAPRKRGKK